jgi:hypothetical protein
LKNDSPKLVVLNEVTPLFADDDKKSPIRVALDVPLSLIVVNISENLSMVSLSNYNMDR